ncbi:MAG: nucleoside triphosphate pyrophosphohydrolase [Armatimonadetes bacterium]|jgi:tetrapyrrole methylase family protein/MazG family protein|nr:nucleoside triphosphate pyrophosphohydrolase [Armatimonadota bacterium]MDI9603672.1 nucleoside triphosphate pyrophosphohydrolase [Acidobacteriota bacterium]NLN90512.1 nucleoside triphosphate pyrophosphohydrolase [candidate division WS1 bacterium]
MDEAREQFARLIGIMERLRAPDGCPWDREQTPSSIRRQLVEETFEVVEAIDEEDPELLCEELGDLLLHIVFQAQMAAEAGQFTIADVVRAINEKLIRRHPHVFSEARVDDATGVIEQWDAIKAAEKAGSGRERQSALDGIPGDLPALALSESLQRRAAKVGFDWPDVRGPLEKIREEAAEFAQEAESGGATEEELGDLIFSIVNASRFLGVSPELAVRASARKFDRRFREVERLARERGRVPGEMTFEELDALWERVKELEAEGR